MLGNQLYAKGAESFGKKEIDWIGDTIKLVLVHHATYTPDPVNDQFLSDIIAGARVAVSGAFTGKTSAGGIFGADSVVLPTVSGLSFESINVFQDTGIEGTSRLIAYYDDAGGLPGTPNGLDITISIPGTNKFFKL